MEILLKPVTQEDEERWEQLLQEELPNQKGTPYGETLFDDLSGYSPLRFNFDVELRMPR